MGFNSGFKGLITSVLTNDTHYIHSQASIWCHCLFIVICGGTSGVGCITGGGTSGVGCITGGGKSKYFINSDILFTGWNGRYARVALYWSLTVYGFLQAPPSSIHHQKSPQSAALRGVAICKNKITMNYVCKICKTRVMADEKPNW